MRYHLRRQGDAWIVYDSLKRSAVESFAHQRSYDDAAALCRSLNQSQMAGNRPETPSGATFGPEPTPWSVCEHCGWSWTVIPGGYEYLDPNPSGVEPEGLCPGCEIKLDKERD